MNITIFSDVYFLVVEINITEKLLLAGILLCIFDSGFRDNESLNRVNSLEAKISRF